MKYTIVVAALLAGRVLYAANPVYIAESVSIGGIQQFITIEGKDSALPILLFLHGGPGASMMSYAGKFTDSLKNHFIVVHWDQRETGRTLSLNRSPVPLTFALFQRDTYELVQCLLGRFQRPRLYLAAHSWGTALGFAIVKDHPDLFYAYLCIGPMIHQTKSEEIALGLMKAEALRAGDVRHYRELASVRVPFENGRQLFVHRQGLLKYAGAKRSLSRSYVDDWSATWLKVFNEASRVNLPESLPAIACPIYFFVGRSDLQTNAGLAHDYFTRVIAPRKAFFWFERSGHAVPTSEPAKLQKLIIETILPETYALVLPRRPIGVR